MKIKALLVIFALSSGLQHAVVAQELSPNAPKDQPAGYTTHEQVTAMDRAIAPYVAKARATYPDAKKRYLAGLPPGNIFFVTVRLHDKNGVFEQVFIAVRSIKADLITGTIASDLEAVKEFKKGQEYSCKEADILDWLISKPDGSEEGNYVGKFLDTYHP